FCKFDNCIFEHFDELVADNLSFLLRLDYSVQLFQKTFRSINVFEFNMKIFAENALDDFFLARAQQTVIDEDTGKLVANRLVQKRSYDRGATPATKAENYFVVADLGADSFAGILDERTHRPIHRAMADVIDKVLQNLATPRGMRDFGMKLQAVESPLRIFYRRERRAVGPRSDTKPTRQRCYFVTMAIPDIHLRSQAVKKLRPVSYIQYPGAVLAASGIAHLTTEMMRHLHQAITNSQDRDPEGKNLWINLGCAVVVNARRAPRQNDAVCLFVRSSVGRGIEADDLRINLQLANAPTDDLGVLRTEIEDENFGMFRRSLCLHEITDEFAERRALPRDHSTVDQAGRPFPGPSRRARVGLPLLACCVVPVDRHTHPR